MFVDLMLDDVPKTSRSHSLSSPFAPNTHCRVFFHGFSAVEERNNNERETR
jgi:hypothetical protein